MSIKVKTLKKDTSLYHFTTNEKNWEKNKGMYLNHIFFHNDVSHFTSTTINSYKQYQKSNGRPRIVQFKVMNKLRLLNLSKKSIIEKVSILKNLDKHTNNNIYPKDIQLYALNLLSKQCNGRASIYNRLHNINRNHSLRRFIQLYIHRVLIENKFDGILEGNKEYTSSM